MPVQTQEARIVLAIEAIRTTKKMNTTRASKVYGILRSTFHDRLRRSITNTEKRDPQYKLTPSEEETLIRYILDLDAQGFPPRINGVKDIADLFFKTHHVKPTGIQWGYRFV